MGKGGITEMVHPWCMVEKGSMDQYIFDKNQDDQELARLRLIEHALDKGTIVRLQSTGIQPGWRCPELGAGAGSIAQWMGEVVGRQGEVVAIDIKTNYLQHLSLPPHRIVEGDFCDVPSDGEFDLAHCRYVLVHNRQSQSILKKLCSLLKPGGFLVVEEPDFTSAKLLNRGVAERGAPDGQKQGEQEGRRGVAEGVAWQIYRTPAMLALFFGIVVGIAEAIQVAAMALRYIAENPGDKRIE